MALPAVSDLTDYLRIDGSAEATLLSRTLASAQGAVESYVSAPLATRRESFVVEGRAPKRAIAVPAAPIDTTAGVTVTDGTGLAVDASAYRLDARTGILYAAAGGCFAAFPYTVDLTWGLGARADYADTVEPVLFGAILDVAADRYQRRNPAASSESAGGGVATAYGPKGLPQRVCDVLDPLTRLPR